MHMLESINPMQIPELREIVVDFLPLPDRKACSLVCKAWNASLCGSLWSSFFFRDAPSIYTHLSGQECLVEHSCRRCAKKRAVSKNGHHIRHLFYGYNVGDVYAWELYEVVATKCQSLLTSIHFGLHADELSLTRLLEQNPGIREISSSISTGVSLPSPFPALPLLRSFVVKEGAHLSARILWDVLTSCPCLEELVVDYPSGWVRSVPFNTIDPPPLPQLFKLRRLRAHAECPWLPDLLVRCTGLQHIQLHLLSTINTRVLDGFPLLSQLDSLVLSREGQWTSAVLKALLPERLRSVKLNSPTYGDLHCLALRQGRTLEHIEIDFFGTGGSDGVAQILAHCIRLRTLKSTRCSRIDIRKLIGESWACVQLEVLQVPMMLSRRTGPSLADIAAVEKELAAPGEPEWLKAEVIFLRRLGGLARLHTIDLRDGNTVDPLYAAFEMSWTLRAGLGQLSGLVHLEVLRLGHWRYLQDIAEFKWMKMRWPNLYRLSCFEIGNEQKRDWLKTYWPELDLIETAHGSEDPSCSNGKARR